MDKFNCDIIYVISFLLNFNDILNLSIINKYYLSLFDDKYYEDLSILYYTNEFWKLANKRPIKLSKPLKNFKKEILRIENFQRTLDNLNYKRWTNKDFYDYWHNENKWYLSMYYAQF